MSSGWKVAARRFPFLNESGLAGMLSENGDAWANTFNDGAADEHHFERICFQGAGAEENIAGELAAVTVAENGHIEKAERGLRGIIDMSGEQDCAGTGAENGVAVVSKFANGVVEAFFLEKLELRGAFATGKDQAVAGFKIVDGADLDGVRAEGLQSGGVSFEVTLDSEDADFHFWFLRSTFHPK